MKKVCCIGIAVADVMVSGMKKIPSKGKLELVDDINLYTGGCAVNVSKDLAIIGVETDMISLVGSDTFGDYIINDLHSNNVKTRGVSRTTYANTSSSIVLSDAKGERSFIHNVGANALFDLTYINKEILKQVEIVVITGSMLMNKFDGEETEVLLSYLKSIGKTTVLDTAWDSSGLWMSKMPKTLENIDYFMPSYEEAVQLASENNIEKIINVFKGMGAKNVIIKNGCKGSVSSISDIIYRMGIYDMNVVDTTGAGDAFVAGFVAGLASSFDPYKTLELATACGAFCVKSKGASTGITSKSNLLKYIEKNIRIEGENNE
jgi:sugar/nucleoside kinase (ribokinase family)